VTAGDLAAASGVHRNVAAARLERLVAAGLLETSFRRRSGRTGPGAGRPAKLYRTSREPGASDPLRGLEPLVALLLSELPRRDRASRLRALGVGYGRALARTASALRPGFGLQEIPGLARAVGIPVRLVEAGTNEAVIVTPACPLRRLVVDRHEAVEVDRGMWSGLVEAIVPASLGGASIVCKTEGCRERSRPCAVRIVLT
jgi:hypothetical protein